MRLGLLSDVHGNAVALDAVLSDGGRRGVEEWWVLGDLVAIGPDPVETLAMLSDLQRVRFLRGNTDRYVYTGDRPPPSAADVELNPALRPILEEMEASFSWTRAMLERSGWLAWLGGLPLELRRTLPDGTRLVGVHASPWSDDGPGITPSTPAAALESMLEVAEAELLVGGHTHRPADHILGNHRVINLGSVGNPITHDPRATYAVLEYNERSHNLVFHRVEYDDEEVIGRVQRSGHPATAYLCSFYQGAQVRHDANTPGTPTWT